MFVAVMRGGVGTRFFQDLGGKSHSTLRSTLREISMAENGQTMCSSYIFAHGASGGDMLVAGLSVRFACLAAVEAEIVYFKS